MIINNIKSTRSCIKCAHSYYKIIIKYLWLHGNNMTYKNIIILLSTAQVFSAHTFIRNERFKIIPRDIFYHCNI